VERERAEGSCSVLEGMKHEEEQGRRRKEKKRRKGRKGAGRFGS
jgi:hypothetical protein